MCTLTAPPVTLICLTRPKERMSREKPGYFTVPKARLTKSSLTILNCGSFARRRNFGFYQSLLKIVPQRGHFTQGANRPRKSVHEIIDFGNCVVLAERNEDIAARQRFIQADGLQYRRDSHGFGD